MGFKDKFRSSGVPKKSPIERQMTEREIDLGLVDTPVPFVTLASVLLCLLVS